MLDAEEDIGLDLLCKIRHEYLDNPSFAEEKVGVTKRAVVVEYVTCAIHGKERLKEECKEVHNSYHVCEVPNCLASGPLDRQEVLFARNVQELLCCKCEPRRLRLLDFLELDPENNYFRCQDAYACRTKYFCRHASL